MLVAADGSGTPIPARAAHRSAVYTCRDCGASVVLRRGSVRIPHYAHPVGATCAAAYESAAHRAMKDALFQWLGDQPWVTAVQIEYSIGPDPRLRADVWAMTQGGPVAVEVQASIPDLAALQAKLAAYTAQGIATLYVVHRDRLVPASAPALPACVGQTVRRAAWLQTLDTLYGLLYVYEHRDAQPPGLYGVATQPLPGRQTLVQLTAVAPVAWTGLTLRAASQPEGTPYRLAWFPSPAPRPPPVARPASTLVPLPPARSTLPGLGLTAPPFRFQPAPPVAYPAAERGDPPAVCGACGKRSWGSDSTQGWCCLACGTPARNPGPA